MDSPHRDESATLKRRLAELESERERLEGHLRMRAEGEGSTPGVLARRLLLFVLLLLVLPLPAYFAGCVTESHTGP